MIKCNVKVCGIINRAASVKSTSDGMTFVAFGLSVDVPSTKGDAAPVIISVAADNADVAALTQGRRVSVEGVLKIKGAAEKRTYFNLSAGKIELDPVAESGITGDMEFRGVVCKDIKTPTDKKGNRFLRFSAYSSDKVGDEFFSVFVRFVSFNEAIPSFVVPKAKIEAKGELRVSTFNGNLDLNCKAVELKEYVKAPF
ncbi:MAG TPA: hypothetical protein DD424_09030 [Porphyromonadaceae bacterium]|nr:hypothetical protein [Porphyromonadaceae bacterium]